MDRPAYATRARGSILPIRTRSPTPPPELDDLPSPSRSGPPSPTDSGYASAHSTPRKRPESSDEYEARTAYTLDGASRDNFDDFFSKTEKLPRSVWPLPEPRHVRSSRRSRRDKSDTVHETLHRPADTRASYSSASLPHTAHRQALNALLGPYFSNARAGQRFASLRRPDRFVHPRAPANLDFTLSDRVHISKAPDDLSPAEKAFRNSTASVDAFARTTWPYNPIPTNADARQIEMQRLGQFPQVDARTTLGTLSDRYAVESTPIVGSVWSAGLEAPSSGSVNNGLGQFVHSRTSAPMFLSEFVNRRHKKKREENKHAGRLAAAFGFDRTARLLQCQIDPSSLQLRRPLGHRNRGATKTTWGGASWQNDRIENSKDNGKRPRERDIKPIKYLSAHRIRDDYYTTPLAFCPTTRTIAVALADLLYVWSETDGAVHLNGSDSKDVWLTALAFSCAEGGRAILAFGRSNGTFGLMALSEANSTRMLVHEDSAISCLSWRPTCTMRASKHPQHPGELVCTEDLLVATEMGVVLYYTVEWPDKDQVDKDHWPGAITLVARIVAHEQQVCGLSWPADGTLFATGGNDNFCCVFSVDDIFDEYDGSRAGSASIWVMTSTESFPSAATSAKLSAAMYDNSEDQKRAQSPQEIRHLTYGSEICRWEHGAAVKAIAFCPWQDGLVATGGGLNDRCIHFFHTKSGAALSTIFVSAQVTGLIWSTTRREIAATFGFAHPSHNVRIAVYSWPECKQVASVPWEGQHRALSSIACHGGPRASGATFKRAHQQACRTHLDDVVLESEAEDDNGDGDGQQAKGQAGRRGALESMYTSSIDNSGGFAAGRPEASDNELHDGVIAVASSDEHIKFYELWPRGGRTVVGGCAGILGGSDILEDLQGIQKDGDVIR